MTRGAAAMVAAIMTANMVTPAAWAYAQAAEPFPEVVLPHANPRSYRWAYATLVAGAGIAGASFAFERRADQNYDRYLAASDPAEITRLYDRTRSNDQLSTATLIGGEVLLATGLWMRFLRRDAPERVTMDWSPGRCVLSLRF